MINAALREPLLHFLLLSVGIFLLSASNDAALPDNDLTIEVSVSDVVHLMQNLDPSLTREAALAKLNGLPADQRQFLVQQQVENEVLFREALKLGLDENDPIVRQRLVQKVRFMLQGLSDEKEVEEEQLDSFFDQNRGRYQTPPRVSFKHRFFKAERNQPESAAKRAARAMTGEQVSDDRFPYQPAYLDRSQAQISQHFGAEFAASIMNLEADPGMWQGPLRSELGYHLVKVTSKYAAKTPSLDDVRDQVTADLIRSRQAERERLAIKEVVSRYTILPPEW